VALALLLAAPAGLGADDVPEPARKKYAEAKAAYLRGDPKSLAAAFSALSEAKGKAPDSVDFWELFARVWRANKKPENDLWTKVIAAREQALPKSATFDLVRARLETDRTKKGEHLEKALAKDPASVPGRLAMAAHLRATGEEVKAEELIDKLIAEKPDEVEAIVAKTELLLETGRSSGAVKVATEALARKECPPLRYALALALRRQAQDDATARPRALEAAKLAVQGQPDPAYVATLADLLDESGQTSEAVELLKTHLAKGADPRLAVRLGTFAFRRGDYDEAVKGLASSAPSDRAAAKALALAHARRGRAKEARAALDLLPAADPGVALFAAGVELLLGYPAAVKQRLAGRTEAEALALVTHADVLEGKAQEVTQALAKEAVAGTVEGEDALLAILRARIYAQIPGKILVTRQRFVDARAEAAGALWPEAKAPAEDWVDVQAKSLPLAHHMVGYFRSACGNRFRPVRGQFETVMSNEGGKPMIGLALVGQVECDRDPKRNVRFTRMAMEGGKATFEFDPKQKEIWDAAEAGFSDGCKALVAADTAKAEEHFGKALEAEPEWPRAKLFRALAKALVPGADLAATAGEALAAAAIIPDDWEARETAILLGLWAGVDVGEPLKALQRHVEERSVRRLEKL
jgi:tetratricopeptide (TPR) repeat protein